MLVITCEQSKMALSKEEIPTQVSYTNLWLCNDRSQFEIVIARNMLFVFRTVFFVLVFVLQIAVFLETFSVDIIGVAVVVVTGKSENFSPTNCEQTLFAIIRPLRVPNRTQVIRVRRRL